MKSDNFNYLLKKLSAHDEAEKFQIINERINKIITESLYSAEHTLEALICEFEARNNLASGYAVMSIMYCCILAVATLITNALFDSFIFLVDVIIFSLLVVSALLLFISAHEKECSERRAFILNALRFRYSKIKEKQNIPSENVLENQIDSCVDDEKTYIVRVHKK